MTEIIDLDKLLPEPKKVRISGKVLDVYPGKIKTLVKIQKVFTEFQSADNKQKLDLMNDVLEALSAIIPDIKKDGVDVTVEQIPTLISIAYASSTVKNTPATESKDMAVKPEQTEKKTLET